MSMCHDKGCEHIFDDMTPSLASWPNMFGDFSIDYWSTWTSFNHPAPLTRDSAFKNIANGRRTPGSKRKKRW